MASERITQVSETVQSPSGNRTIIREKSAVHNSAGAGVVAARIVYYIAGVIVALLALRVVLLLLAANQGSAFVDFIYTVSGLFAAPFFGIFSYTPVYGSSVLEVSSVVAIIIYALFGWGIGKLFTIGNRE